MLVTLVDLTIIVGINAIATLSLYLAVASGQLSICHGALAGVGGYASALTMRKLGLPFEVGILMASLAGALVGAIVSATCLKLRGMVFAIATLAVGEALTLVAINLKITNGALGLSNVSLRTTIWHVLAILAVLIVLFARFRRSRWGIACLGIRSDPEVASGLGINPRTARVVTFAVSGAIAGISGSLAVHYFSFIHPDDLSFMASFDLLIFLALGGIRTFTGALLGAALLTLLPEVLRFSMEHRYILYGVILVLLMVFRPNGLLSRRRLTAPRAWRPLAAARFLSRMQPRKREE